MIKKYVTSETFLLLGCCFIAIGIPCDGFLRGFENTGLIAILMSAALNFKHANWKRLFEPLNIALILLFLICVFGYFFTYDIQELNRKSALKVLFILFPIAFAYSGPLTDSIKRITILLFTLTTALLALLSCIRYFLNFKAYNQMISESKPIEIVGGTMHIYFSVIMALAVFLGIHLLSKNFKISIQSGYDKFILTGIGINLIALHILSARTGLFAFYFAMVCILIRYTLINRRYRTLIGGIVCILMFPTLMYFAVPSIRNRINNTYEDMHRYFNGDYVGYYSISGRFETWKTAIHIFKEHKLFGVGSGDLQSAMEAQYKIDDTRLMREEGLPNCHNQYLETLAAHGILGFVVFMTLLFTMVSMVKTLRRNNYMLLAFCAVFIMSFTVESLLERQAGATLFLFFLLLIRKNAEDIRS